MAKFNDNGQVVSNDGEWLWNPDGGIIKGGSWERIAPATKKPSLAARLFVKSSAQGRPGLTETMEADKLQPSAANRKLAAKSAELSTTAERMQAEVDQRRAAGLR